MPPSESFQSAYLKDEPDKSIPAGNVRSSIAEQPENMEDTSIVGEAFRPDKSTDKSFGQPENIYLHVLADTPGSITTDLIAVLWEYQGTSLL